MTYARVALAWLVASAAATFVFLYEFGGSNAGAYRNPTFVLISAVLALPFGYLAFRLTRATQGARGAPPVSLGVPKPNADGYCTAFVSFGTPDRAMAEDLVARLGAHGVDVWFFPKSAKAGEYLSKEINQALFEREKVLVLCSRQSLDRPGVLDEIEKTLARETKEARHNLLVPVLLDDYLHHGWQPSSSHLRDNLLMKALVELPPQARAFDDPTLENILRALRRS